ncbi:carboxypeptidase regulatory-like domain-containing protein [Massilia sp. DWR3-1-1]|uniref:TonB-dependent receptor n=1 Tax=Massilia sp. DWR3-1-1 TaxID=2804559 RepID=UPI003CF3947A
MIIHKRIQLTKMALALSIALATAPAFAQNTTSAIAGRISGADGKPTAGATVQIVHIESGSVSTVTTDAEGRYNARGLRTGGPFTITITKNGISEKRTDVYTQLAETAAVDATLGAQIQTVTVTGAASRSDKFSRNTMGSGTNIGATELATQASIQRNLQDYARADPRVSQTDKERGEISVAGQNSRYNTITIDGVAVNDTFGLESNGSPTARQPISIEAIQSVQVNVANYDVTQKGYTGANINAVTKSGTNDWKGGVYYVTRDDRLVGDRYNATSDSYVAAPAFKENTKGAYVSGPLIQDKLFIFALLEEAKSSRSAPDFGQIGTNTGTTVGITQSSIDSARSIAQSRYGVDIGTTSVPANSEFVSREQMIKVDYNINDNHRASVRYSKTSQADPVYTGFSATGVGLSSQFYNQGKSIETIVGQVLSDWTPNFSTELKFSTRDYDSVPTNTTRTPAISLQFSGALPANAPAGVPTSNRFINFGTESSRHLNVLRTDTRDIYAGGTWTKGDHEVKFGSDFTSTQVYNAFLQNINGNYTFGCRDDVSYTSFAATGFKCASGTTAQIEAAVLENFSLGRPLSYTVQQAVTGGSLDNAVAKFTLKDTGLFVQDTWNVNKSLTITGGVRVDYSAVDGRPATNAAAALPMVAGNATTNVRQSGGFGYDNTQTIDGQKLIQPRIGFNLKLPTERLMQVRGGIGLFQGAAAAVWMSNPFSNTGVASRVVTCSGTGATKCPTSNGTFSINPDTQPSVAGAIPAANVDFLDPNFHQPAVWKANIAFETELPWQGIVFSAEYLRTKNKDGIYYENLNLGAPTKIGTDGRNLYYNAGGYQASCFTPSNGSVTITSGCVTSKALSNLSYGNVMLAKGTDLGEANVGTVSFSRPLSKGYGWSIAATKTTSTEVSSLTSSVSTSNWNGRSVFNPNENIATNSSYLVKDRINALFNFQKKFFGTYNTRLGVFYEGRSGKPYSWTVNNDLNGDGLSGNDRMYIPKAFGSGDVLFYGDTATSHVNEQKFWDVVNANKVLRNSAGGIVGRNTDFAPWTNSIDLRISQEIPGLFARNKASFSLDFLNFGNLLNKKWGRINEVGFQSSGGLARSFVDYVGTDAATGKYVYAVRPQVESVDIRQAKGESQWAVQATFKYDF